MRRKLFPILAAGSLALWLAVAVAFVRSFWVVDTWTRSDYDGGTTADREFSSASGRMRYMVHRWTVLNAGWKFTASEPWSYHGYRLVGDTGGNWYRPYYDSESIDKDRWNTQHYWMGLAVPYWPFLLLLAIPPALWLHRSLRLRHRQRLGLCRVCGYDLRATPDRCPECGTAVAEGQRKSLPQVGHG